MNLSGLSTEQRNPATMNIDDHSAAEIVKIINDGDRTVAEAVSAALPFIAQAAEAAADSISKGGRLIYMGAGTSGRLGVLDAVECRPTYGIPDGVVVGIIAGGMNAMFRAVEGAEDSFTLGEDDLRNIGATADDTVVGIASSGRTPYVIGALKFAKSVGCTTVSVACSPNAAISALADIAIEAVTGPEAVTGSTRMKAGTAQKMILNMISTTAFILMGKVYGNLMIDVQPTNEKLVARAVRIIRDAVGCTEDRAAELLDASGKRVKHAVVMGMLDITAEAADVLLSANGGNIRRVLKNHEERI
ncbi:MAG: N-acetylmuramic acid 6-phosphate etherase [Clostridia bacterium]|nr:N-acetylmuramic acid 6-phosphate etherase [Clostridia bacterium]